MTDSLFTALSAVPLAGIAEVLFALISLASAIVAVTPTPRDDLILGQLYRLVEILALNFGHAKDQPPNKDGGRFVAE